MHVEGKADAALQLLSDDRLQQEADKAKEQLHQAVQGWLLKGQLLLKCQGIITADSSELRRACRACSLRDELVAATDLVLDAPKRQTTVGPRRHERAVPRRAAIPTS